MKTILPDKLPNPNSFNVLAQRKRIITHFPKALETLVELLDSENESIRLAAALKIIEHTIGKAPQSIEISGDAGSAEGYALAFRDMLSSGLVNVKPQRVIEIVQVPGEAIMLSEAVDEDDFEREE